MSSESAKPSESRFNPELWRYDPEDRPLWQVADRTTIATMTWNRKALVARSLQAIFAHADMPFDLLVLDNGSEDGTWEMLQRLAGEREGVTLIRNLENVGKGRGMMQLQEAISDGLVLYLDSDVELLSRFTLVHLHKAFHALARQRPGQRAVLGLPLVNCKEYGFQPASGFVTLEVAETALPRCCFSTLPIGTAPEKAGPEQIVLAPTDWLHGGSWACFAEEFRSVPYGEMYPAFLGGVDGFASRHWAQAGALLAYLENGPIARHNDWPYSEEKIRLYTELEGRRANFDLSFLLWKLRRLLR